MQQSINERKKEDHINIDTKFELLHNVSLGYINENFILLYIFFYKYF